MKKILLTSILTGTLLASALTFTSTTVKANEIQKDEIQTTYAYATDYSTKIPSWSGYKNVTSACGYDDINVSWNNSTKEASFARGWGELKISLRTLQNSYGVKLETDRLMITYNNYVKLYDNLRLYM
ncbi:hypothetical protein SAMN02745163_00534 [Clostridium cavendishii DSM 21758]|uniref:Uncharacterized protein n=1 Tax=Clostridium cavendishii DSM 21758 TaxID=1121302 RepID=A0A1M6CS54_9CLOT|nr:hypothetical protein [Clostridium cavendishii]SHI63681.1 hypothetical protein SAMN02745163_00534 [Clostridium cavendishii DSM 21758]